MRKKSSRSGSITQSEQWCARITGKETVYLLGSLFRCLLRISSAHLASLDSIRNRLIDFRWNPRLTSSSREYHVVKYLHRSAVVPSFGGSFLQSRFPRRNVTVSLGTPVKRLFEWNRPAWNRPPKHRTLPPPRDFCPSHWRRRPIHQKYFFAGRWEVREEERRHIENP